VRLILDDGEVYAHDGKLLFSDTTVDPGTGQVTLRGEFPNPKLSLLPGMYVRVQIEQGVDPDALAVPQQAVRRNDKGGSEVFVVREDNRAKVTQVRLGRAIEDRWLILDGVKPGDRVIVRASRSSSRAIGSIRSLGATKGARGRNCRARPGPMRARQRAEGFDRCPPSSSTARFSPGSSRC
jgi:multidrug efflux pump subunit AcrA (membrane-fusion protein)